MTVPPRMLAIGAALAAALLVVLANVHLVYVSIQSQPECVAHLKPGSRGDSGAWSAARSSC